MRTVLTTAELAAVLGIPPGSVARWARTRGLQPRGRIRAGRSTVTIWHTAEVAEACAPARAASCA